MSTKRAILRAAQSLTAAELMDRYCPQGNPVDGVDVYQDWDTGTTSLTFAGGLCVVIDGPHVDWSDPTIWRAKKRRRLYRQARGLGMGHRAAQRLTNGAQAFAKVFDSPAQSKVTP